MKTYSTEKPQDLEIELLHDNRCYIKFSENVVEVKTEDSVQFEFDYYFFETEYINGLEEIIRANFGVWLNEAKKPKQVVLTTSEKVNILEQTQETQDAEIIDNYEATAMLYEQMSGATPLKLVRSIELSPMATIYKKLIESGKRTINTIPENVRKELE